MIGAYAAAVIVAILWAVYGLTVALCVAIVLGLVLVALWLDWRAWTRREAVTRGRRA